VRVAIHKLTARGRTLLSAVNCFSGKRR